jgi:enoyl-CoA hydratase/carnithine racemase
MEVSGELVHVSIERGVATITLDSPANRNALSLGLVRDLHAALDAADAASPRAIVLTHTSNTFCAGADLKERGTGAVDSTPMVDALKRLSDSTAPTIAAVKGAVRAGGVGLMASCDLVVVAPSTTFAFTEVRIGVAPAIISVPILARVQPSLLRAPFLTGETFDAPTAKTMGLITHIADADDSVDATVATLVEGIRLGAPAAVAAAKAILRRVPALERDAAYEEMRALSESMFLGPDGVEGMASFREKRKPSWVAPSSETGA